MIFLNRESINYIASALTLEKRIFKTYTHQLQNYKVKVTALTAGTLVKIENIKHTTFLLFE